MNYKMNSNGLIPSILGFGVLSRINSTKTKIPARKERMNDLVMERREIEIIATTKRKTINITKNILVLMSSNPMKKS